MRHLCSGAKLNRTSAHRKALLRNLAIALLEHRCIRTTLPKAKALRSFIEPLISKACRAARGKSDSLHTRRLLISSLSNLQSAQVLMEDIGPKYSERPGGYLRILKTGFRYGDAAPSAIIEFVEE